MVITKNQEIYTNSLFPNTDFIGDDDNLVIDESTQEGLAMVDLFLKNHPFVDFEHDGKQVTKVILLPKPDKPVEVAGKNIVLKKINNNWAYEYQDIPLTREQELERRITFLESQLQISSKQEAV